MPETSRRMSELLAYMDETRRRLVDTATQIAPAFASVRPRSGAWSAAENLAHLAKVEEGVARMMERSVEWARSHGVGPSTSDDSVMASLDEFRLTEPVRKLIGRHSHASQFGNDRVNAIRFLIPNVTHATDCRRSNCK